MVKHRFKISKFTNPSGQEVYRVSGTLHGKRIRENYASRDEATETRQKLEIRFLNEREEGKTIWTTLTQEENADAITALHLLRQAKSKRSLTHGIKFYLEYNNEAAERVPLSQAVKEYQDEKSRDLDRGIISRRQYDSIKHETERFKAFIGDPTIGEIQTAEIKKYLDKDNVALKTWNNRRGLLNTFFKFCVREKYAGHNAVDDVPQYKVKHRRSTAETLSTQQVKDLMTYLESYRGKTLLSGETWGKAGCMVPYFALALFAGIRPDWQDGELKKLRPEHIDFDNEVIRIEPEVSKVNEKRVIKLQPNLRLWLEKYPLERYPVITPKRFPQMRQEVRDHFGMGHNVLRHTFISMLVGAFRSVGDASLQAGNSEAIIRRHYLDLKTTKDADEFWRICPSGMSLPEKMDKDDGRYVIPVEETRDQPAEK